MTTPVFIVSSGRSGTLSLTRMFELYEDVEFHHEYHIHHVQPLAFKFHHGIINIQEAINELWKTHGAGFYYTESKVWGDSSNKLSWLVPALSWMFPQAKWVQLVRDGRKVVSSFYNKLGDECYGDEDYEVMKGWAENTQVLAPPPDKKYWWNIAPDGYDRFQRLCWHWANVHKTIEEDFEFVDNKKTIRLEDLTADSYILADLLHWLGLEYDPIMFKAMQIPYNVHTPEDHLLTDEQTEKFWPICKDMMDHFGYEEDGEYQMEYEAATPKEVRKFLDEPIV